MNIFRLLGDLSHLLAIIILLLKIWKTRSCAGISGRSQILFAITYTSRYLDLALAYISAYNSIMKLVFIGASYATIYLMYIKFKATYDRHHDTLRVEFLLIPAVILALLINHEFSPVEIMWTFSIYLESVAILPQLFMVSKTGEAESITSHYLFALGSYRALYLFNWIYRYYGEGHYDAIAIVAGVVQTVLYCDFFYLYITKDRKPFDVLAVTVLKSMKYDCLHDNCINIGFGAQLEIIEIYIGYFHFWVLLLRSHLPSIVGRTPLLTMTLRLLPNIAPFLVPPNLAFFIKNVV